MLCTEQQAAADDARIETGTVSRGSLSCDVWRWLADHGAVAGHGYWHLVSRPKASGPTANALPMVTRLQGLSIRQTHPDPTKPTASTEIPFLSPGAVKLGVYICHGYSINGLQYTLRGPVQPPMQAGKLVYFFFFCLQLRMPPQPMAQRTLILRR